MFDNYVFYTVTILTFFQWVKPMSLGKNWKFCISLVWDKMGLETISDDDLHVVKEKTSPP